MKLRPILDLLVPVALVGGAFVILSFAACSSSTPTPEQKHTEARASYAGMLANCVADAKAHMRDQSDDAKLAARLEYDACRDSVNARWGVDGGGQ